MKTSRIYQFFIAILLVGMGWLLQGCPVGLKKPKLLLYGETQGYWEWVRTTTPTRVITPATVGYKQHMVNWGDAKGVYVAFYKNDTLQRRVDESAYNTVHVYEDETRQTVLVGYGSAGFLKYYVASSTNFPTLSVSEFLDPYSIQADTVRHYYKRATPTPTLYPY